MKYSRRELGLLLPALAAAATASAQSKGAKQENVVATAATAPCAWRSFRS